MFVLISFPSSSSCWLSIVDWLFCLLLLSLLLVHPSLPTTCSRSCHSLVPLIGIHVLGLLVLWCSSMGVRRGRQERRDEFEMRFRLKWEESCVVLVVLLVILVVFGLLCYWQTLRLNLISYLCCFPLLSLSFSTFMNDRNPSNPRTHQERVARHQQVVAVVVEAMIWWVCCLFDLVWGWSWGPVVIWSREININVLTDIRSTSSSPSPTSTNIW